MLGRTNSQIYALERVHYDVAHTFKHSKEGEEIKHQEGSAHEFKLFCIVLILKRARKVGPISILIAKFNNLKRVLALPVWPLVNYLPRYYKHL